MEKRIGLQLYTLREAMSVDFVGTLEKVAAIGYRGVEFAGYGGFSAKELRHITSELGITPVSSHLPLDLLKNTEQELEYAKELGLSYVVCPWLPEELRKTMEQYRQLAETLEQIGEKCARQGIILCYHNHAFEFELTSDTGVNALDEIYANTSAVHLQAELDTYWVAKGNLDPLAYLRKYAKRCPLVHLKDMANDETRSFAELGRGTLDIPAIIETASASGADWLIVEQDVCNGDPLESVAISFDYLRKQGFVQ